ncbi:MAG: TonB-dependent receptor, partial [Bryobacteraceae bacterium]
YTFAGQFSRNTIGDFLLGLPQQFRQGGGQPAKHFVGYLYGFYLQDDIRVTRRLTLNVGMRYELPLPYYDKQDRLASFQPGRQSTVQPKAPAGLLFPGDAGVPRATIATDKNNFAPRFGFAYDLNGDGKTSIRGGYGIFYDATPAVAAFQNINVPPFNRFVQIDYRPPTLPSFANPYRDFAVNPQTDPAGNFPCPCLVIGFSPDFRSSYAQHFNFTLQRQLARDLMVEAGYAGSLGRKLAGYLEINPAGPGAAPVQQRRLYRDYTLIRPTFSRFNSNYNALQLRVEKRLSAGLGFSAAYTWSKAIDFQSSVNFSGETRPQDAFSLSDVRGLAAFDVRHRVVSYFSYELPWMKTNRFAGGWQLQGIIAAQSGGPLTAFDSVDRTGRALSADRPDQIRNPNEGPKVPERWFDTGAFAALSNGSPRSGTAGRNTIIGPGLVQTDLNLMKNIRVRESQHIEFRAEAFNVINRPNFFDPATNISAPQTFGVIQTARPARVFQLALKYHF